MSQGTTQSTQTIPQKKLSRNGKPKMSSKRAKEGGLPVMSTPREKAVLDHQNSKPSTTLASEILNLVHEYKPKVPHVSRPFREYTSSPERIPPRSAQTPQASLLYGSSSHRSTTPLRDPSATNSERNFNLSTTTAFELPKRPASCVSPLRWSQQLENVMNDGFQSMHNKIGLLKKDLTAMGSLVGNLSTAINILTNMQGVLVEKVVDYKVKDNRARIIASEDSHEVQRRSSRRPRSSKGSKDGVKL